MGQHLPLAPSVGSGEASILTIVRHQPPSHEVCNGVFTKVEALLALFRKNRDMRSV